MPEWDNNPFARDEDEANQLNNTHPSVPAATIAIIVIMLIGACAAMVAVVGFVVYTNYYHIYQPARSTDDTPSTVNVTSHAGSLEANGDDLKEAMEVQASIKAGIERAKQEEDSPVLSPTTEAVIT
jgi:hypothetical protein